MDTLPDRFQESVLKSWQHDFETTHEAQVEKQTRILKVMERLDLLDNVIVGPFKLPEDAA